MSIRLEADWANGKCLNSSEMITYGTNVVSKFLEFIERVGEGYCQIRGSKVPLS